MTSHLMPTYSPQPINFTHGSGVYLYDDKNNKYLDAMSGIAVTNLGHCHPNITSAITEQAEKILHLSNIFQISPQEELANNLCQATGMDNVFFGNSGAEANEAAIKLARVFGHNKGVKNPTILCAESSFHGRTMATISASHGKKYQDGFTPLLPGFVHVPYNDVNAVKQAIATNKDIVAVMIEPVQGEGGVNIPDNNYLPELEKICNENDLLFILDEIQTGMGRTGKLLAKDHSNVKPHVITMAKALANGVPIGACLARGKAKDLFSLGMHGSTFGGNPLSCHVGNACLNTLLKDNIITNVKDKGERLVQGLKNKITNKLVKDIRGIGLMVGIEMDCPARPVLIAAIKEKLLVTVAREFTVRLLPPLIISDDEIDMVVDRLSNVINRHTN